MAAAAAAPAEPLEYELQQELCDIIIQGCISGLRRKFEMKLCENQNHISTLSKSRKQNLSEVTALRDELANIVAAASEPSVKDDSEQSPVAAQTNEAVHYIPDFSLIKHMGSEEINSFLKTEWLQQRREYESELQTKTEEIFRLKREFAKDGAVLPFRKERELEFIKSKLLQTISKMDGIISRKEASLGYDEDGELCRFKDRIGSLVDENEHLRGLLSDKRMEAQQLSSQVVDAQSDVARCSLSEARLLNRVEKLGGELDDLKTESHLKDLLELSILREAFGNYENQLDDRDQEECLLRELIMEKEEQLRTMSGDRHKLKYENDQLVSIVGSTLVQHHEEFDLVNDELTMFQEKVCEQELLILEFKSESNSMKNCLYEALQQIHVCKKEICGLTESLTSMSVALEEAKEQNASLDATIREMKRTSGPSVDGHGGHEGHLEFDLVSMEKMSNAYSDFESKFAQRMKQNEIRLTSIVCQFNPLVQQVAALKKKEFWHKQIIEIKCSNLRKAEAEVDILGDEVDTLLSVLGKIYIALDHYSPVLKHYPGVTEILNLVQKVLRGESVKQYNTLVKH